MSDFGTWEAQNERDDQESRRRAEIRATPFRILVTGSRDWDDWDTLTDLLSKWIKSGTERHDQVIVVHGGARGADEMAGWVANSLGIDVEVHPVLEEDWQRYGKGAGHRRNAEMVRAGANVCLAFIKNNSSGATGCAALARGADIFTVVKKA